MRTRINSGALRCSDFLCLRLVERFHFKSETFHHFQDGLDHILVITAREYFTERDDEKSSLRSSRCGDKPNKRISCARRGGVGLLC